MKVYIVSSGCVFGGGTNRHVALSEARAIELAEALVDKFKDDVNVSRPKKVMRPQPTAPTAPQRRHPIPVQEGRWR